MKAKGMQYCSLVLGVLALSTSAIFVKLAHAPSSVTAFYRLFFAMIILLPFLLTKRKYIQTLLSLSKKQWVIGIISGLFLSIHYVLWFESLQYTSVASSTVIVTLQPLFAFVGSYFLFKEKLNKGAILGCLMAMLGCFIIGWGDIQVSGQALLGDLLAFAAAGVITIYFFIGEHMRTLLPVVPYSILGYSSSAFFLALYTLSQGISFIGYPITTWSSFIALAVISTILGQMVLNWLLKWLSTSIISMSILGETVGTCFLAYLILGELISIQQGTGIGITLGGLGLFLYYKTDK